MWSLISKRTARRAVNISAAGSFLVLVPAYGIKVAATRATVELILLSKCGRLRLSRAAKLAERFGIEPEDDWVPRYNIAPAQNVEAIRQHAEEPKRFGSRMRWGLIPCWEQGHRNPSRSY